MKKNQNLQKTARQKNSQEKSSQFDRRNRKKCSKNMKTNQMNKKSKITV